MKILSVQSRKGGVGKTTLSLNLAIAAEKHGIRSVVLDLDPQASASSIGDIRKRALGDDATPEISAVPAARLQQVLNALKTTDCSLVVLDTPPHSNDIALASGKAADLALIPCRPSIVDALAIQSSLEVLQLSRTPALGVLSIVPPPPHIRPAEELKESMRSLDLEVCSAQVTQRIAFQHAFNTGLGVVEYEPGGKASAEITKLLNVVLQRLGIPLSHETKEALHG